MAATIYGKTYNNATKVLINPATVSCPTYTVTNTAGAYNFTIPGAATIDVTSSATGFTPKTTSVSVSNGQIKKVDFYLDPLV